VAVDVVADGWEGALLGVRVLNSGRLGAQSQLPQ